jgi:DNA helicase-2/ATP-dependent DNA helicase PcrA
MENSPDIRKQILEADGHLLVLGGPGSGKTTIALLKAAHEIQSGRLDRGQKILFLSFARATIARVIEHACKLIPTGNSNAIEINTYHGFIWNLVRSHGYLICPHRPIRLLTPADAASRLAHVDGSARAEMLQEIFEREGILGFDLFAPLASELLRRCKALLSIISDAYPIIIVDEFQDTNQDEWDVIQLLGQKSRIIALADAEQRIYEFRGADPARIGEFIKAYSPAQFDFGNENNRSNGTDIVAFGNDLLKGSHRGKLYNDVEICSYGFYKGLHFAFLLKAKVMDGIKRLTGASIPKWSIAILVPTKRMMLAVSDCLTLTERGLPLLHHEVAIEQEALALSAVALARLLEGGADKNRLSRELLSDVIAHVRGRRGNDTPSRADLELTDALNEFLRSGNVRGKKRTAVVSEVMRIVEVRMTLALSGDPGADWLEVRRLLNESSSECIVNVADDAKYLRLLNKGATLRERLNELWRRNGSYVGATTEIQNALVQEHFTASTREWSGIHVMTIHKSKGKEFDEVFIFEGYKQGKLVRVNAGQKEVAQAFLALRVAVTRAKRRVTILSPGNEKCALL